VAWNTKQRDGAVLDGVLKEGVDPVAEGWPKACALVDSDEGIEGPCHKNGGEDVNDLESTDGCAHDRTSFAEVARCQAA